MSWPSNSYVFGLVTVQSQGVIYVTVSTGVNVLLKIPMHASQASDIVVVAGDPSMFYGGVGVDTHTPYLLDGFGQASLRSSPR